jgi:hypothetical protein
VESIAVFVLIMITLKLSNAAIKNLYKFELLGNLVGKIMVELLRMQRVYLLTINF